MRLFIALGAVPGRVRGCGTLGAVQGCTAAEARSADASKRDAALLRPFGIWARQVERRGSAVRLSHGWRWDDRAKDGCLLNDGA